MEFDPLTCLDNIRKAETEELLDRVTAYRAGMEPQAIDMIEEELRDRGVSPYDIAVHEEECERECVFAPDGAAYMCCQCRRPFSGQWMIWMVRLEPQFLPLGPMSSEYIKSMRL